MNLVVPWVAAWTAEQQLEVRPCRWVGGQLALWNPHRPGEGHATLDTLHMVRQRRSICEMRCPMCGGKTSPDDRWWLKTGRDLEGYFMTADAPLHRACVEFALTVCPDFHGREKDLQRLPDGYRIRAQIYDDAHAAQDGSGLKIGNRRVASVLTLAWPSLRIDRMQ